MNKIILMVGPSPKCLEVHSGFCMGGWCTSLLGDTVKPSKDGYHAVRNKSLNQETSRVQQSIFIDSLIPLKYCSTYIDHI